jgi:hypothetical protein
LPEKDDVAELGIFDLRSGKWDKLAETSAFNFQQGCMLQWNPKNPEKEIIYNTRDGAEYKAVIQNIETGEIHTLPRPVANISKDGKWGLSTNFSRNFEFRACCGYAGIKDKWRNISQPEDDGVWLLNMETGVERFILSYKEIGRLFSIDPAEKLVVNHITFSPDNNRLLFLLRNIPLPPNHWLTGLGTIDREGENFHLMNPMSMASHYCWRDNRHLLVWTKIKGDAGMYILTDQSNESLKLDPEFFCKDIHCIYSPDKKYILGDGYPDKEGYRQIYLYNTESKKGLMLLRVKSDPIASGDIRADLHNRWSRNGRLVSFDSTHEGYRGLYLIELTDILEKI